VSVVLESPGSRTPPFDTPIVERRARNAALFFDAFFRSALFAVIFSLFLSPVVLIPVELILQAGFSAPMILSTLFCLFLAVFALTSLAYRRRWRQIGSGVQIFPDRLVFVRKGKSIDFRWNDIREFYCRAVDEYNSAAVLDQTYLTSRNYYRFVHRDGYQFDFGEKFRRDELVPIADYVTDGLLQNQLPDLHRRYFEKQETLTFGPLRLEPEGIGSGGSILPWEDVDFVGAEKGKIFVRKKDKTLRWCAVKAEKVPNSCLFLALAKERCD
jgi:hypothetical protein